MSRGLNTFKTETRPAAESKRQSGGFRVDTWHISISRLSPQDQNVERPGRKTSIGDGGKNKTPTFLAASSRQPQDDTALWLWHVYSPYAPSLGHASAHTPYLAKLYTTPWVHLLSKLKQTSWIRQIQKQPRPLWRSQAGCSYLRGWGGSVYLNGHDFHRPGGHAGLTWLYDVFCNSGRVPKSGFLFNVSQSTSYQQRKPCRWFKILRKSHSMTSGSGILGTGT